ncbi:hypothetical protein ABTB96_19715, partial [Acinetobacter baumannii]
ILELGVIDQVVQEPLGGAHHDYDFVADNLKQALIGQLEKLTQMGPDEIRADRQAKFRKIGAVVEAVAV